MLARDITQLLAKMASSLGSSKKGYWVPSEQGSERTPRTEVNIFCDIILEVISHHFSYILVEESRVVLIKYRIPVKFGFR